VKLINGSGKRAGRSEQPPSAATVETSAQSSPSSATNEHPATHRRVAAVLDDLGAASR
jgi:hypothetical protein